MAMKWTRERWAQIGITIQFLALVRTLGEFFRLKYDQGAEFTAAVGEPFVMGALITAVSCWTSVTLYFLRRNAGVSCVSAVAVITLLEYKVVAIGW